MYSDYRKEIEASPQSPKVNGHSVDLSYITLNFVLSQIGSRGLSEGQSKDFSDELLAQRGAKRLADKYFGGWFAQKEKTIATQEFVEMLQDQAYLLTPAHRAVLEQICASPRLEMQYSPKNKLIAEHPINSGVVDTSTYKLRRE